MSITLHLPTMLARLAGDANALEARGDTVGEALTDVIARFPALGPRLRDDAGKPYGFVTFYLNDEDIRFHGGFEAPIADGDEVIVVPTVAGG
ncbi:MAG TPA: MoaD/ThiS family protein [Gemmatimonadaceae bacterium]|jgi:molybdopterin converting factor small subunit|nr:MoaD/ThiS family protein [Gemmatimonadaceae bacterium]